MNIRKIVVVGSFAAGAALAFAPLASADSLTDVVDTEISSLNSLFTIDTTLAGVPSTDIIPGATGVFDTINPTDVAAVQGDGTTAFDFLTYGVDPTAAGLAGDPGSFTLFNGALVEFDDALNAELFGLENSNALIPTADLFGSANEITTALATGSDMGAATDFFSAGLADLSGFFDIGSLGSLF